MNLFIDGHLHKILYSYIWAPSQMNLFPPGDKHLSQTGEGRTEIFTLRGGGTNIYTQREGTNIFHQGGGQLKTERGGTNIFSGEEEDVSEASKLLVGARISWGPQGSEILVQDKFRNFLKYFSTFSHVTDWCQLVPNGAEWCRMVPNGAECRRMSPNGTEWC